MLQANFDNRHYAAYLTDDLARYAGLLFAAPLITEYIKHDFDLLKPELDAKALVIDPSFLKMESNDDLAQYLRCMMFFAAGNTDNTVSFINVPEDFDAARFINEIIEIYKIVYQATSKDVDVKWSFTQGGNNRWIVSVFNIGY